MIGRNRELRDVPAEIVCFDSFLKDLHRALPCYTTGLLHHRFAAPPVCYTRRRYTRHRYTRRRYTRHRYTRHRSPSELKNYGFQPYCLKF